MSNSYELKKLIKGDVTFLYYSDGALWYNTSDGSLIFPVPIDDIGTATFKNRDRGILFMRYIRKYLESINAAKIKQSEIL